VAAADIKEDGVADTVVAVVATKAKAGANVDGTDLVKNN